MLFPGSVVNIVCFLMLTTLPRTARKQPLLSSDGSSMKKSLFSESAAWSELLNGDGQSLQHTDAQGKKKALKKKKYKQTGHKTSRVIKCA